MVNYRLTHLAQADISGILLRSHETFGQAAEVRYAALITAAIRDAAERSTGSGFASHPELGDDVVTWHLAQSRGRARGGNVRRPRHFLVCRREADILVIGRVLHDAMDLQLHVTAEMDWS